MMTNETYDRSETDKKASDRTFGLFFSAVFCLTGLFPLLSAGEIRLWAVIVSAVLLVLSMLHPSLLSLPHRIWMKFGLLLHRIMSPVIIAGLFFIIVTPYAMVLKIFRKDVLPLSFEPESDSYWIVRSPEESGKSLMTNQF
jgi:predicted membrane protein